jgi:pentatricopeptide repeat protein
VLQKYAPLRAKQWMTVLDGLEKERDADRAVLVLRWMEANDAGANRTHFDAVVTACSRSGDLDQAEKLLHEMDNKGLNTKRQTPLRCTLEILHTSSSAGAVDAVLQKNALRLNPLQWTSVLNGLGWKKQGADRAVLVLRWMEANGTAPNDHHYQSVLRAYEKGDNWEQVHELIAVMHNKDIGPVRDLTRFCAMELQQADASASSVDEVLNKYTKHAPLQPQQWASLLNGFAKAEDDGRAILVLRWMEANGAAPSVVRDAISRHFLCDQSRE